MSSRLEIEGLPALSYSEDSECSYGLDEPSFDESISDYGEIRKYKRTNSEESMLLFFPEKDQEPAAASRGSGRWRKRIILIGMVLFSLWMGLIIGETVYLRREEVVRDNRPVKTADVCNPYEQHGVLLVNTSYGPGNIWSPIAPPPSCEAPTDFVTLLAQGKDLAFARNRLVVLYGDSIDRNHVEHFCALVNGTVELIGPWHRLSPPTTPEPLVPQTIGGINASTFNMTQRQWIRIINHSRPWTCHVKHVNLVILNTFHFGFQLEDPYILTHPYYHKPAGIEDRFDQILKPVVASVAKYYKVNTTPDIISITPGFWDLLRYSVNSTTTYDSIKKKNETLIPIGNQSDTEYSVFRQTTPEQRVWFQRRMQETIHHIARAWMPTVRPESGNWAPRILWRTPHHVQASTLVPYNRVQTVDQIGRAVVEELIRESKEAELDQVNLKKYTQRWVSKAGGVLDSLSTSIKKRNSPDDLVSEGLASRLKLNDWGSLMLGQEHHFADQVHPLPLPGSYLYSNMLLQQLKDAVES